MRRVATAMTALLATTLLALGVTPPATAETITTETTTYTGVRLEWTGSQELQTAPPFGGSNYFSAGESDGTAASYLAVDGDVSVLQRGADGTLAEATWGTRAAHVNAGGQGAQIVRFDDGRGEVASDGSASIAWEGSWSVNFYGGLVPFTVTDPRLTVDAEGTGTLVVDLTGYAGSMADPNVKEPLDAVDDVVMATFTGVTVDAASGTVITPEYSGVAVDLPAEATPQNRSVDGWGAWPQPWVDFQLQTGLSSYWYSSGGAADSKKAPAALLIGFDGAVPEEPEPTPTPTPTPSAPPAEPAVAGALTWGVKSSFRSYITGPIAKGAISLSGGATTSGGAFKFWQGGAEYNPVTGTGSASYGGTVQFTGHSGVLNLSFSSPSVRIDSPTSGALAVSVNGSRVEIGTLSLGSATRSDVGGGVSYSGVPVTLTGAGASVFAYGSSQFYGAGTAMDSLSFTIGANSSGGGGSATVASFDKKEEWVPPAEPPARDGIQGDATALAALHPGSPITVWTDGFQSGEEGIRVVLYSDPVVLDDRLAADATGKATWSGILPADLAPGEHVLTFQGSVNRGIVLTVTEKAETEGCPVVDASMTWGFKETFRSYISGSIAHGEWTVSDGASYETPAFGWSKGAGAYDLDEGAGLIDFAGTVRFTGHDGLLDTRIANPSISLVDEDSAFVLLDVAGVTMEDALAGITDPVVAEKVPFVRLDLSSAVVEWNADGTVMTVTDAPAEITAQGYEAFPNYEPGTAFDPVLFTVTVDEGCEVVAAEDDAAAAASDPTPVAADGPQWLPIGLGAGAALLLAAAATYLLLRRRRATRATRA